MPTETRELRLARRPEGLPDADTWDITTATLPDPAEGEFLVRVTHLSLDPAMRGWLDDRPSYLPPVGLGEVMRAGAIGTVVASRNERFPEGTTVSGGFGVVEYAISDGRGVVVAEAEDVAPETWLGVLGGTGLTAYFGLFDVGALADGETVLVSGAAGAVGTVVVQLAKIRGCRVIGIAGGEEKCRFVVDELGADACIDYRGQDVDAELARALGDDGGVDVYFDNVGGEILDIALMHLARDSRIVLCGAISQYNETGAWQGPANYWQILVKRARMQGFLVFDFAKRFPEGRDALLGWLREGRITPRADIVDGTVEDFNDAFLRLFRGANIGKVVLRLGA
jgi:NADPH-dependent curcumin reductase CurA